MGRHIAPTTTIHTNRLIERAAARAERDILRVPLAAIVPLIREGILDVELGLDLGANGGLREVESLLVRRSNVRLTVGVPIEKLARGRIAPLLVAAMLDTLAEIREQPAAA